MPAFVSSQTLSMSPAEERMEAVMDLESVWRLLHLGLYGGSAPVVIRAGPQRVLKDFARVMEQVDAQGLAEVLKEKETEGRVIRAWGTLLATLVPQWYAPTLALPRDATRAMPGTEARIKIYEERAGRGEHLHHPGDFIPRPGQEGEMSKEDIEKCHVTQPTGLDLRDGNALRLRRKQRGLRSKRGIVSCLIRRHKLRWNKTVRGKRLYSHAVVTERWNDHEHLESYHLETTVRANRKLPSEAVRDRKRQRWLCQSKVYQEQEKAAAKAVELVPA